MEGRERCTLSRMSCNWASVFCSSSVGLGGTFGEDENWE